LIGSFLSYVRLTTEALSRIELVLAATAIAAGLAFWTWADFSDAHSDARAKVAAAAVAVDELASRSLLAIDVVLETVVTRAAERGLDTLRSEPEQERLKRIARRLPETGTVFIADKAGDIVASTASSPVGGSIGDREWFGVLQDGKEEIHVGRALKGRSIHTMFFPVARAIRAPDGSFQGAAQVGVEVTYIAYLFRSLDVGSGAHLGLYGARDGKVVARYPMTEALLQETVSALPYFSAMSTPQTQSWTGWINDRGREDLVSARRLNGWPLIVSASLPKAAVYSGAWTRLLWRSLVSLADLIGAELEPYATGANTTLDGPIVHLAPDATHTMAMVIHELTTNAAKYGALSQPGGQVSVRWTLTAEHSPEATLKIQWVESGGPRVLASGRQGYGSRVIRDMLTYELGGNADLEFAPSGVRCTIELPALSIVEMGGSGGRIPS
jgi:hypothetical protein